MYKRFVLRWAATAEKEQGAARAAKGFLMLILGLFSLLILWLFGPYSMVPVIYLKAVTVIMFVGSVGWIWIIVDGLRTVAMAKKYLREWEDYTP